MEEIKNIKTDTYKYERILRNYEKALEILKNEFEDVNEQLMKNYAYSPIIEITQRIKSINSINKKLTRKGYDITLKNIIEHINDIAGIRIICQFIDDIYEIIDNLEKSKFVKILNKKDYIKHPKKSGYSSLHLIVLVAVPYINKTINVKAEIQLRTKNMDLWSNVEHKIIYKNEEQIPLDIKQKFINSANVMLEFDKRISEINKLRNKKIYTLC